MPLFEIKTRTEGYNYYEIEAKDEQSALAKYQRADEPVSFETTVEEVISVDVTFDSDDYDDDDDEEF